MMCKVCGANMRVYGINPFKALGVRAVVYQCLHDRHFAAVLEGKQYTLHDDEWNALRGVQQLQKSRNEADFRNRVRALGKVKKP